MFVQFSAVLPMHAEDSAPVQTEDQNALTPEEQKTVDQCIENITKKTYAPDKAAKCLDDLNGNEALFAKLQRNQKDQLVRILKYQNIFKELGDFYDSGPNLCRTRNKLVLTLERVCAVCDLEPPLGPQPEKLLPWVKDNVSATYYQKQLLEAGLAWNKINDIDSSYQLYLASHSYTEADWKEMTLQKRMATLTVIDLLNSKKVTFYDNDQTTCDAMPAKLIPFLYAYLDPGMRAKLDAFVAKLKADSAAVSAAGASSSTAKTSAMSSRLAKLFPGGAGGDQFSNLGRTFDGSAQSGEIPGTGPGTGPKPSGGKPSFTLSADDMAKLSGRLESSIMGEKNPDGTYAGGELKGTKSGEKLLAFYNQKNDKGEPVNKLDFTVTKLNSDNTGADYCPTRCAGSCGGCKVGQVRLNSTLVETWMKEKGVTAEMLLDPKNDEYVKRLARYSAPTVVHEETHQQKNREDLDNKIKEKYQLDDEVRTFGAQSLFLKEKLSNPATEKLYMKDLRPFDDTVLQKIETGGYANLKKYIRYYDMHALEGASSQEFTRFEGMLKEANLRANDKTFVEPPENNPACWEGNPKACSNAQLQAMTDKTLPWYQASIKEQRANILTLNSEIARLNTADNSGRYKKLASPVAGF